MTGEGSVAVVDVWGNKAGVRIVVIAAEGAEGLDSRKPTGVITGKSVMGVEWSSVDVSGGNGDGGGV
jgi:hypothetical protein